MPTAVGGSISRQDGRVKVTGRALYAADHPIAGVAHAVAIQSTIANGRITAIDSSLAEKAPGVLAVIHHGNAPKLYRPGNDFMSATKPGEGRVVFEDDRVHYLGQYVAIVVAETLEQARYGSELVKISYDVEEPIVHTAAALANAYLPEEFFGQKLPTLRGDPDGALARAAITHKASYTTPIEHHNPMEPSASIAAWKGDQLTLYETTQWVAGARKTVAQFLGMPEDKIHIVSPFIGGGFGC